MVCCQYCISVISPRGSTVTRIVKLHLHFDVKAESSKLVKASWVAQPSMPHVTPFQEVWIVWKMCVLVHCSAENLLFYLTKAHNAVHSPTLHSTLYGRYLFILPNINLLKIQMIIKVSINGTEIMSE